MFPVGGLQDTYWETYEVDGVIAKQWQACLARTGHAHSYTHLYDGYHEFSGLTEWRA